MTLIEQIFREHQIRTVEQIRDGLDDEIYEAAAIGNVERARYLEWCKLDVLPRCLSRWEVEYRERRAARQRAARAADVDLRAELMAGDVLVSTHGTRWTVTGWSPRGKLTATSPSGTEQSWWWRYRSDVPKNWGLERDGVVIR